jgi:DNA repair exonuclease SbcCD ATPase subunit
MIRFTKIKWKNFLSTGGQFTEINFESSPSTLIVGENGAGKSTILDAICFVLFNKPFRNINKPQLMNRYGMCLSLAVVIICYVHCIKTPDNCD